MEKTELQKELAEKSNTRQLEVSAFVATELLAGVTNGVPGVAALHQLTW